MVKDHSDSESRNTLLPLHGLLFFISTKGSFICTTYIDKIAHNMVFAIPVMEHGLKREIAQWVHDEGLIQ